MIHFIDMNDVTNQAILNCLWIIHCYVNPCMLLIFNKSVWIRRKRVKLKLQIDKRRCFSYHENSKDGTCTVSICHDFHCYDHVVKMVQKGFLL
uniref:G_PROTEIN_RECEP_F1_2 domain-containing protein n=1 Tax=Caenorhabditis tropicalis TaxID=1561998 RepID=A0A1I7TYS9_9PELO